MRDKVIAFSFVLLFSFSYADTKQDLLDTPVAEIVNKDFLKENALHDAVRAEDLDLAKFLIEQGTNIDLQDQYGFTPLHIAVRIGNHKLVEYLVKSDANLNTKDVYGDTPLLDATRNNDTDIAKTLICNGALRNVVDSNNMSTLNYSSKNNNRYVSELLRATKLDKYCKEDSEILVASEGDKTVVLDAFKKESVEISFGDLSSFESSTPVICGTIVGDSVTKVEITVSENGDKSYGPYEASIDGKSWCATVEDPLVDGAYMITASSFDKIGRSTTFDNQFYLQTTSEVYNALYEEFAEDLENWNGEITENELRLRFNNTDTMFEHGSKELKNQFKKLLDDFIPRYIDFLLYYKDDIKTISIEGHSSSAFSSASTKEEKFQKNKALSNARAEAVLRYIKDMESEVIRENIVWIITTFKPLGMSSSKLIFDENGEEDPKLSRRIEFAIDLKKNR